MIMKKNLVSLSSRIKNINNPICKSCVHFIEHQNNNYSNGQDVLGNCSLFGEKNLVTGEIKYDYAFYCRKDFEQCGEHGEFFEKIKDDKVINS